MLLARDKSSEGRRRIELGDGAAAVAEATSAGASERDGRPGGEVDAANALVSTVLPHVGGGHRGKELILLHRPKAGPHAQSAAGNRCTAVYSTRRVCALAHEAGAG